MLSLSAKAQVGVIAGVTSPSTDVRSAFANIGSVDQYHFGLSYRFKFGDVFAVQPALLYNVRGSSLETIELGQITERIDFRTGFLELPVQLQAGVSLLGLARLYVLAEPFVGYAITNSIKDTVSDVKNGGWEYVKNRFEYGAGFGAGIELLNTIQLNVKYVWNLGLLYGTGGGSSLDSSFNSAADVIRNEKCSGIAVTAAIFF